jgi:hypothetical protein
MPLGAFIQSGRAREANNEKMSPLGIVLPKSQLFALGARPVIYGLSSVPRPTPGADGTRALPDSALPPKEQYRYVAYNPTSSRGPDWTHEREWRWPLRAKQLPTAADYPARVRDIPGLDLYRPKAQIRGAGVIVQSKRQAHLITHDLLRIADQGTVPVGTFDFILILDALPPAEKLRDPVSVKKAIEASTVSLSEFMSPTTSDDLLVQKFRQVVSKVASSGPTPECGEFGGCWLWLRDNTHPMARALLRADQIDLSKAGRYLVRLPEFQDWNLSQKRDMADRLAALVARVFKIPCLSFRVSGTEDPDGLPFHCDDTDDGGIFYNSAWSEGDL